jgi:hypothetical protein
MRADGEGGAVSSDCGALLLRGVDRQMGLPARRAAALHAQRHRSSIAHPLRDLLAQRLAHIASGDADGNDAQSRRAPLCPRGPSSITVWRGPRSRPTLVSSLSPMLLILRLGHRRSPLRILTSRTIAPFRGALAQGPRMRSSPPPYGRVPAPRRQQRPCSACASCPRCVATGPTPPSWSVVPVMVRPRR